VAKQYLLCLSNATAYANLIQIDRLVQKDIMKIIVDNIERFRDDKNLITQLLEALENILKAGEFEKEKYGYNRYVKLFESVNGHILIENLQLDSSDNIYQICFRIVDEYFESMMSYIVDK
jgi:hypothetical protein